MVRPIILHKLWSYPPMSKLWDHILSYINTITAVPVPKEATLLLFHSEGERKTTPHWVHLSLLLAKRQILQKWISAEPMLVSKWQTSLKKLMYMDKLHADMKEARTVPFFKKWRTYIEATLEASDIDKLMESYKYTTWYAKESLMGKLQKRTKTPLRTLPTRIKWRNTWRRRDGWRNRIMHNIPITHLNIGQRAPSRKIYGSGPDYGPQSQHY